MKILTVKLNRAHRIGNVTTDEFSSERHPHIEITFRDGWVFFHSSRGEPSVTALGVGEIRRFTVDPDSFILKRGRPPGVTPDKVLTTGKVLNS